MDNYFPIVEAQESRRHAPVRNSALRTCSSTSRRQHQKAAPWSPEFRFDMGRGPTLKHVRRYFSLLPVFGRLIDCSTEQLSSALQEVVLTILFATIPVWFIPMISWFIFTDPPNYFSFIKTGELFIYSAAFAGPLVYIISKRYGKFSLDKSRTHRFPLTISFPYGGLFIFFATGICLICGFSFALLKTTKIESTFNSIGLNEHGIVYFSTLCFGLTVMVLYCVTAYRNMLEDVGRTIPDQEGAFVAEWLSRKR